jgi:magnesium-transporting ATPase (P-type)
MGLQKKATNDYRAMSTEDVASFLKSGTGGLSETEAAERLKQFGPNEIREQKKIRLCSF